MRSPWRALLAPISFGLFAGLMSILWNQHGIARLVMALVAGASLMVALQEFTKNIRDEMRR